ncbi:hypothetical protein HHK36_020072 [Tetracentron sinense]|nr:hypothetical protein HHK36_029242 [Tetracentron sinense]KAF8393874.1 hypothetical protein HHK36_020072 [Tetracentron sinense]
MSSAGQQGDMPPSSSAPRRRGANKLKRVQEATEPLVVDSNTYGQPCNDVECPLARFIGLLIRDPNLLDINVKDWRKVPNDRKEMLYDTICVRNPIFKLYQFYLICICEFLHLCSIT